jgi:hypothetical protein
MPSKSQKSLRALIGGVSVAMLLFSATAASARPSFAGHGGGNIGGHFSAHVSGHISGGGFHPSGGMRPHPVPHRPVPHPVPHPPHPHPMPPPGPHPGPHPHPGPYPHPYVPWVPGALVWGAVVTDEMWDNVEDEAIYVLPTSCSNVTVSGQMYDKCTNGRWYQMVYHGSQVAYIQVPDPR